MGKTFVQEIMAYPGGETIMACMQCGTCTGSCPSSHAMEYTPRKLIALIRANQRDTVLKSLDIWKCASCYSCASRCPRSIKFTDIMYILKSLAWKEEKIKETKDVACFYGAFQGLIEARGRISESELIMRYSFKSNPAKLFDFTPLGIRMILKGRASFVPDRTKNMEQVQKILKLAREKGGE